jgi:hypothetical protein
MLSRTLNSRGTDAYRSSSTATLSDFPLLIGEILRRSDLRFEKRARRQARIQKIGEFFTLR